jgi:hypothetical protein
MRIPLIKLVLKHSVPKTFEILGRRRKKRDRREGAFSFFFVLIWI